MNEIEQFRKSDLEHQTLGDLGEINQQMLNSDHITLQDDLEYSGDAASEDEQSSFVEQQNGLGTSPEDSPLKIKLRQSHNGESWLEELSIKFEHRYILLIFVSYFSLGTKILTDVALK